ncbi:capon-like protein [Ceratitis capitata]|uniref:capon-like protein n=1 Tax=Ceratitis capitata TaxID=7213 RepID=UPI000C6C625E|nr:capon-like protein [Ceratitis capitata]
MPSTPYDLVQDEQDLRVPLHAEQAFFHGITFQAKVNTSKMFLALASFSGICKQNLSKKIIFN